MSEKKYYADRGHLPNDSQCSAPAPPGRPCMVAFSGLHTLASEPI